MYQIIGTYRGKKEVIDTAETRREAEFLAFEYQLAYGHDWIIEIIAEQYAY